MVASLSQTWQLEDRSPKARERLNVKLFSDLKILYHMALKPVRGKDHAARRFEFDRRTRRARNDGKGPVSGVGNYLIGLHRYVPQLTFNLSECPHCLLILTGGYEEGRKQLSNDVAADPSAELVIDLETMQVFCANSVYSITMKESAREAFLSATYDPLDNLLSALDDIKLTAEKLGYV